MEKIRKEERKGCLQVSGLKAPAIAKVDRNRAYHQYFIHAYGR